jgi:hypothetical protein
LIYPKRKSFKPKLQRQKGWNKRYKKNNPVSYLLTQARRRAKQSGLAFDLSIEDLLVPEVCPYLKTAFVVGTRYAASIDRIDNTRGYVKGNVEIISRKANTMKNDASVAELLEFAYTILERH